MTDPTADEFELTAASVAFHADVAIGQAVEFIGEPGRVEQLHNLATTLQLVAAGQLDSYVVGQADAAALSVAAGLSTAVYYRTRTQEFTNG